MDETLEKKTLLPAFDKVDLEALKIIISGPDGIIYFVSNERKYSEEKYVKFTIVLNGEEDPISLNVTKAGLYRLLLTNKCLK